MIVPITPVTALKGISESVNVLDRISTTIIKAPPNKAHSGIVRLAFLPTNSLTICGTTNPIQDIVPQKQTDIAVNNVEIIMITYR